MRLVWVVIPLVLIGIIGISESFADESNDCKDGKEISLNYDIAKGNVLSLCSTDFSFVLIEIEAEDKGTITIDIPSNVLASTDRSCIVGAVDYFVLVNGAEVSPDEKIIRGTTIVLTIPFNLGHHEIEIISGINHMLLPNPLNICGHVHGYDKLYLPPVKQIKLGNFLEFIRCNQGLELIFKHNDSPACVKPQTAEKLMERGWTTYHLDKQKFVQGNIVRYAITGDAIVTDIINDQNAYNMIIPIDTVTTGILTIEIPRDVLDTSLCSYNNVNYDEGIYENDKFGVLIDGEEINFEEIKTTPEKRTLLIPFEENSKEIEIITTCVT